MSGDEAELRSRTIVLTELSHTRIPDFPPRSPNHTRALAHIGTANAYMLLTRRILLRPATSLIRAVATAAPPTPVPLHLLLYTYVDNAAEQRAPFRAGHIAAARAAEDRKELVLGGALADPLDGAVLAFTGREVAESFARADPYVLNGIVTDWTIREWTVVVGGLYGQLEPPGPFIATYEWQAVHAGGDVPAGLDVELWAGVLNP